MFRPAITSAQGRRLPGHCDGMERVPAAGFRANAEADARTGGLRRPQSLYARADETERLHLLLHWSRLSPSHSGAILVTEVRATSAAIRQGPAPFGPRVVIFDNLSAGHREAGARRAVIEGDIRDVEAVRRSVRAAPPR